MSTLALSGIGSGNPGATLPTTAAPSDANPAPADQPNPLQPVYVSPAYHFDPQTEILEVIFRNSETGQVKQQFPPADLISRYRDHQLSPTEMVTVSDELGMSAESSTGQGASPAAGGPTPPASAPPTGTTVSAQA